MTESRDAQPGAFRIGGVEMERRRFLQAMAAMSVVGPLASCGDDEKKPDASPNPSGTGGEAVDVPGPPASGGTRGGTGISLWQDATMNFDPPLAYGRGDYYGLSNFYRGLAFYDEKSQPVLDMAESVDIAPDGLTYTFKLKPNQKFHNGRTVTAADFKWTFERSSSKEIASWVQGFLGSVKGHKEFVAGKAKTISGIVAKDDLTLVLNLSRPDVTILNVVGIPPFYVLAKEEVARLGKKISTTPIGTGPYKLASWDESSRTVTGERFADYQYADELPYLDKVEYQWGVTEDVSYLKVSRNQADLTMVVPESAVPRIKKDKDQAARFKEWQSFTINWWQFDVTKAPFNDVRVRKAFNHAFNRDRLKVFGYAPTGHFYPSALLGYKEDAPIYDYNPDKAKALLQEAGATSLNLTLPVTGSTAAIGVRIAQFLQQDLEDVGVTVKIEQVRQTAYDLGAELPKKYSIWNMAWGMGLPDPSELVSSLVGTGAPSNYGKYSNKKIDALGEQAIGETDRAKRGDLYAEIEKLMLEDAAFLFLGVNVLTSFTSKELQNFMWEPVVWTYWDRYWKKS